MERARGLRNLCFQKKQRFLHEELGYNYRMTNLQAALGLGQVRRIEQIVARKREIAALYNRLLQAVSVISLPLEESWARNVYWVYGILLNLDAALDAVELTRRMAERGIETRPFFLGMHEQPVFNKMGLFAGESYPVAERLARFGLYIPSGLGITAQQQEQVVDALKDSLA